MDIHDYNEISAHWPDKITINNREYRYISHFMDGEYFKSLDRWKGKMNTTGGVQIETNSGREIPPDIIAEYFMNQVCGRPIIFTVFMAHLYDFFGNVSLGSLSFRKTVTPREFQDFITYHARNERPINWQFIMDQFNDERIMELLTDCVLDAGEYLELMSIAKLNNRKVSPVLGDYLMHSTVERFNNREAWLNLCNIFWEQHNPNANPIKKLKVTDDFEEEYIEMD